MKNWVLELDVLEVLVGCLNILEKFEYLCIRVENDDFVVYIMLCLVIEYKVIEIV